MIDSELIGQAQLVLVIILLGLLYVTCRYAATSGELGPISFVGYRFIFTLLYLVILYVGNQWLFPNRTPVSESSYSAIPEEKQTSKDFWLEILYWGSLTGFVLSGLVIFVQFGLLTETAGAASFIIGMYVIVVPFGEFLLSNCTLSITRRTWLAAVLACAGLFFVSGCADTNCFTNSFQIGVLYLILGTIATAAHLMISCRGGAAIGTTPLVISSFTFAMIISVILSVIFEPQYWVYPFTAATNMWWLIAITALLEVVSVTLLTSALAIVSPTKAAVITSVESLSGAIFGYLILGEAFTLLEILGGVIMLAAVATEVWPLEYCCCNIGETLTAAHDTTTDHTSSGDEEDEHRGVDQHERSRLLSGGGTK